MAELSISVDEYQFSCPVCQDLLMDPVTIPCGHSFCMVCINACWDQEDQWGIYSCPQCRETFTPSPVLRQNSVIAEMLEKLKNMDVQAAPPAGSGDVECDFCTGRKLKAVKSCLTCLASFCEDHLKPHSEIPAWKKHKLAKASTRLQEKICSQHDKLIEIYCRTDRSCICYLCTMDDHRGHDTISAAAERTQKQMELKEMQGEFLQMIQEEQNQLQKLEQAVNVLKEINSMGIEEHLEKLEQEIADLKRRNTELEQLSLTEDPIHFLQSFQSLSVSSGSEDSSSISDHLHLSFDGVRSSLSDLKERLEEFCREEFRKIPPRAAAAPSFLSEPKSREDFLQYFCQLTLDPNTANRQLILSKKHGVFTFLKAEAQPGQSVGKPHYSAWVTVQNNGVETAGQASIVGPGRPCNLIAAVLWKVGRVKVQWWVTPSESGWNEEALKAAFQQGLSSRVKDKLATRDAPDPPDKLIKQALKLDKRLQEHS
ncbi:hypothetical protein AOLI_G00244330 [Acnodon oligacanthus]